MTNDNKYSYGTDTIYFQYDSNGTPLGFIWNGTLYLYLTNQMGDVIYSKVKNYLSAQRKNIKNAID